MPRSKDPDHYPREYLETARQCALENKEFIIHLGNEKLALQARARYYAWIGSMARIQRRLEAHSREPTRQEQEWLDNLKLARRTQAWIEKLPDGTAELRFRNKEMSPEAQMLRNAKVIQHETVATGQEDFMQAILEEQNRANAAQGLPPVGVEERRRVPRPLAGTTPPAPAGDIQPEEVKERLGAYGHRGPRGTDNGD